MDVLVHRLNVSRYIIVQWSLELPNLLLKSIRVAIVIKFSAVECFAQESVVVCLFSRASRSTKVALFEFQINSKCTLIVGTGKDAAGVNEVELGLFSICIAVQLPQVVRMAYSCGFTIPSVFVWRLGKRFHRVHASS